LADPICTFIFSVVVLLTTKSILRDIVHVLMERTPTNLDVPAMSQVGGWQAQGWRGHRRMAQQVGGMAVQGEWPSRCGGWPCRANGPAGVGDGRAGRMAQQVWGMAGQGQWPSRCEGWQGRANAAGWQSVRV
jgi:hypothetical protein